MFVRSLRRSFFVSAVAAALAFICHSSAHGQTTYVWNVNAAGTWDTSTANWTNGGVAASWVNGNNIAVFGNVITANRAIAVAAGGITAGQITFDKTGTLTYTVGTASNNITLNNGGSDAAINVNRGVVGTATYSGTGGNTITGSSITFSNNLNIVNDGAFGTTALTIAGNVDRGAAGGGIVFSGQGNTAISGTIGANVTTGLTQNGTGTVILSGATNAFTGGVTINNGVLGITSNDAMLGNVANTVTINNGGTFRFNSTVTSARGFNVSGTAGIDLASGTTATLTGSTATTGLVGSGTVKITLTGGTTAGTLSVEGAQTGFTGNVVVGSNGLEVIGHNVAQRIFSSTNGTTLRLQNAGALANATGITVNNGAALTITQSTTAVTGRTGTAPLTMHGGRFQYNTSVNGNVNITENLGTVTGTGILAFAGSTVAGGTGGTTLNFGNLTLNNNGVLLFRSPATGTGSIGGTPGTGPVNYFFANLTPDTISSGVTRSVVPFAYNTNTTTGSFANGLMTYDANGFRPLAAAEMTAVTTPAGLSAATGQNVNVTAAIAVAGSVTINSFSSSTGTPTLTGSGTITVTSGAFQHFNALTLNGPVLNFGGVTGYIYHGDAFTVTGAVSEIQGTAGIVFSHFGTSFNNTTFSNTNGNSFSGGLTVNGLANVRFTQNNQLGRDGGGNNAGQITLGGGQLIFAPAAATTVSLNDGANNRPIVVTSANGTIGTSIAAANMQIPGTISGSGQVQFGGAFVTNATGIVELTNTSANTYTGGTVISTGILRLNNSNQLGTGKVFLNGGNLQAGTSLNFSVAPTVVASSTIDTQANNIVLAGGLNGSGGTAGSSAQTSIITKAGTGILNITGSGNYAGGVTLGALAGTLTIDGNGRLPELGAVTIGRSGTFNIDNSTTNISDRTGRATNLTLSNNAVTGGATLNLTTNASGSTFAFGSLTVSGGASLNVNTSTINLIDGGAGNNSITFTSLTTIAANNVLNFSGTANFGQSTAAGTHLFFQTAPTLSGGVIANANFTGFGGSGQATYDATYGVILYVAPVNASGTVIDNIGAPQLTTNTNFTTTGDTTAKTGVKLNSLTLDVGNNLNLVQTYAAAPGSGGGTGNGNTPIDTLLLSNGLLTVTATGPKTITATTTGVLSFGASNAAIAANSDLTIASGVTTQGTGGLAKSGAGTLTINGTNSLGGDYNLSAGNLTLNTSAASVGSLTSAAATTFTIGTGATVTSTTNSNTALAGTLAGAGNLVKAGTGTLTVSGLNSGFTGNVTVTGGNVQAADLTSNLGTGAAILTLNGGGLNYTGTTVGLTSAQTPSVGASGGTINVTTAATTMTMGNNTWYGGNLTKAGPGTLQNAGCRKYHHHRLTDGY